MRRFGFWLVEFLALCLRPVGQALAFAFTFAPLSANAVGLANLRSRLGLKPWAARVVMAKVHLQYVCYFFELVVLWPLGLIRSWRGVWRYWN